ncbi:uncharacterized protein [Littorina saxatilis]|uniref:EGF-like domain-containing protein n=1 Tax=Littorina saxatilis TaxID=31220 RepID=A0AAN9GGM4_9CAEN
MRAPLFHVFVCVTLQCFSFTQATSGTGQEGCTTRLDFIPQAAITTTGFNSGDALQVMCFTSLWPSTSPSLLSLTLGVYTSTNSGANAGKNKRADKSGQRTADSAAVTLVKTDMAKLAFPGPSARDSYRGFPNVTLSPGFEGKGVSAMAHVPSSDIGLGLEVRMSSVTCDLAFRAFFCTASSCEADKTSGAGCGARLVETLVSPAVVVKGCPSTQGSDQFATPRCTQSRLLTGPEEGPDITGEQTPGRDFIKSSLGDDDDKDSDTSEQKTLTDDELCNQHTNLCEHHCGHCVGGDKNCKMGACTSGCLPGYVGRSCNMSCPQGYWGDSCATKCKCQLNCTCASSDGLCICDHQVLASAAETSQTEGQEEVSAYIIMGVSFAGGFIVGASLAGVCWCVKMSDSEF